MVQNLSLQTLPHLHRSVACLIFSCLAWGVPPQLACGQTERPTAMQLFPAETVLWIRTADAGLLVDRLRETSFARMLRDPEVSNLTERAYQQASSAYAEYARDFLDAELGDLLRSPQGEVAFGLINRAGSEPGLLLIADFADEVGVANQVVERLKQRTAERGALVVTEKLRSDEATVLRDGNNQSRSLAFVQRASTFVIANDPVVLQTVLDRWDGIPVEPFVGESADLSSEDAEPVAAPYARALAKDATFSATLRELQPGNEEPPQALLFVDPVGLVEAVGGRQTGVRIAMATFPALGIDGIRGFGAAAWLASEKWDSFLRGHLLLANPRAGVVKAARLETGETAPPDFVPAAVENFMSLRVEPTRLFEDISGLYDRFQFEGAFRSLIEKRISSKVGVDFEEAFVGNLEGSLYFFSGYDESGERFGAKPCLALGLLDAEAAVQTLEELIAANRRFFEEQSYGGFAYHNVGPPRLRERIREGKWAPPLPALAIVGDHLVFCQSDDFFRRMLHASEGGRPRLNESLQYRLIRSRLTRLTAGRPFSAFGYHDTEPMLRHLHQIAKSDEARASLDEFAEGRALVAAVRDTLDGAEVPPLETLLQYNAPSGSVMIDTPTGWHMMSFSIKRASE